MNEINDRISGEYNDLGEFELRSMTESYSRIIWVMPEIERKKSKMGHDTGSVIYIT